MWHGSHLKNQTSHSERVWYVNEQSATIPLLFLPIAIKQHMVTLYNFSASQSLGKREGTEHGLGKHIHAHTGQSLSKDFKDMILCILYTWEEDLLNSMRYWSLIHPLTTAVSSPFRPLHSAHPLPQSQPDFPCWAQWPFFGTAANFSSAPKTVSGTSSSCRQKSFYDSGTVFGCHKPLCAMAQSVQIGL